ncbi:MAG: RDD family protein [Acidobacteria bacterium]|nr:RDD family protein [Acidobacteriota bacterium]
MSESAKRKFTLLAGLVGFLFFIVQAVIPLFLILAMGRVMRGFEPSRSLWPHVESAVYWNGSLWYAEESLPRRMSPRQEATLQELSLELPERTPRTACSLFMEDPRLLAGSDRLWIISPEDVRYFKDGQKTALIVGNRLGNISYPFLLEGRPAVLEERPGGMALTILRDRLWERGPLIHFGPENEVSSIVSGIRVIPCAGGIHLFMDFGQTIQHREGLPQGSGSDWPSWEPVAHSAENWSAACMEGQAAVFVVTQDTSHDVLIEYRRGSAGWVRHRELPLTTWGASIGVVPEDGGTKMYVLATMNQGSLGVMEVKDGELADHGSYYRGEAEAKFGSILKLFLATALAYLASPIALACLLSGMMTYWRISGFRVGGSQMELAPIWRRALAEVVDTLVQAGPLAAGYLMTVGSFLMPTHALGHSGPGRGFAIIVFGIAWAALCLFLFSFLEGRWGWTPGKWIFRIKVLGTDLQPCGFLRGLVRNLLRVVDGFFNFMVGLLVTALSENWQRVGDMAARTIVVRAGRSKSPPGFDPSHSPGPDVGATPESGVLPETGSPG